MKKCFPLLFLLASAFALAEEGKRPYELDWAGRTEDEVPPIADFESGQWTVETAGTIASFEISNEQKIWGEHVGKLTYRRDLENKQDGSSVILRPEKPIPLTEEFDVLSCWIYGNNWAWASDPKTPRVDIDAILRLADGSEQFIRISHVMWKEWFLEYRKLSPNQVALFNQPGTCFNGLRITNARNEADRVLYFDNFAVRKEVQNPLTFEPRPKRGVVFPEQIPGTNNGPGVLPFPTREETIQPDRSRGEFRNSVGTDPETGAFVLKYEGEDGRLKYTYVPKSGGFSDLRVTWNDGQELTPCAGGGVTELVGTDGKPTPVLRHEHLETRFDGEVLKSRWNVVASGDVRAVAEYRFSIHDKTLRMETSSNDAVRVAKVVYGGLELAGLADVKVHPMPYYGYQLYGHNTNRPGVISFRDSSGELFLMGNTDWYAGNGSTLFSAYSADEQAGRAVTNGGVRYSPKTDGTYNPCYERFFLTFSPEFAEVLPNIPNPASPWKHVTGRKFWFAHGAGVREDDKKFFYNVWRHGMREVLVTDHETCWRDGGESFTFRTKAAPGRGGDEGMRDYARYMQDTLGFTYGPYNNFTDFAPVNEYWSADMISRTSEDKLQPAWARCYAPKPARAVEYCAKLSPINQEKYHFSTAYCDVHTSVTPWSRVDYDARVPGAGTYAAVFYPYSEIMLLQKAAWNGPVYSEGPHHCFYVGLTDGNYAQDQGYDFDNDPWLVDFDLLKMHPLACNFGMGNPGMFYGKKGCDGPTPADTETKIDRFIAATAAFGHPGFLNLQYGLRATWRGYFLLQQLQSRYTLANVKEIRYVDANGVMYPTSEALRNGAASRSQLVIRYDDGTVLCVNGNGTENMQVLVPDGEEDSGIQINLPPNGLEGWTKDLKVQSWSELGMDGKRYDYAISPEYIYLDGRGSFQFQAQATGSGAGVCRREDDTHWELIPMDGADMMFHIPGKTPVSAVVLNHAGEELGPATLRTSRGYFGVTVVPGAFSYRIEVAEDAQVAKELDAPICILPGQTVTVTGESTHEFTAPADTPIGTRLWAQFEGKWIDFGVVPLAQLSAELDPNTGMLNVRFHPNLSGRHDFTVQLNDEPPLGPVDGGWMTGTHKIPPVGNVEGAEESFRITLRSEGLTMAKTFRTVTRSSHDQQPFDPARGTSFCQIRDKEPTADFGETGGSFDYPVTSVCGEVSKTGLGAHPPYHTGPGRSYRDYEIQVPDGLDYEFCTSVGKRDGSVTGDGILYQIAVVNEDGTETVLAETVVLDHVWTPLRAPLKNYRGQTIRLRLIVDCGKINDTSGDWAAWSDIEIRTVDAIFRRTFLP